MLDLVFFRPVGYFIVKIIYRIPVSPNQISLLSMVCGVASAGFFSLGESDYYRIGAAVFLAANILDCMDGQLARLQGSGTFFGRVVDGVADYVTGFAVFAGLGIGMQNTVNNVWFLVFAAGISAILHGMTFDYYQGEFIRSRNGHSSLTADDVDEYSRGKNNTDEFKTGQKFLAKIYRAYFHTQGKSALFLPAPGYVGTDEKEQRSMIRWWSFLGPTTNRSLLIIFCLIGMPIYYLYVILIPVNCWFISCLIRQSKNAAY